MEPSVAIDFGTSRCAMAWYNPQTGHPEALLNAEGELHTPSIVYWGSDHRLVGKPAAEIIEDADRRPPVITGVKRDLGRELRYPVTGRPRPFEVAAEILRKLKSDAEELHFHAPIRRVTLTHPVVFSELEKERLSSAASEAGFREVVLLDEPVAAALAYAGAGQPLGERVLVYDLGGGTLDLALLARDSRSPRHLRSALPPHGLRCGGDDFDRLLYDHCRAARPGGAADADPTLDLRFLAECRRRKESLSLSERPQRFSSLVPDEDGRLVRVVHELDRATLERLLEPVVHATVLETERLLAEARERGLAADTLILIGGSSRVPMIARRLAEVTGLAVTRWEKMDLAVVLGAATPAVDSPARTNARTPAAMPPEHRSAERPPDLPVAEVREETSRHAVVPEPPVPPRDFAAVLEISLEQAFAGGGVPAELELPASCSGCGGSGKLGDGPCGTCRGEGAVLRRRRLTIQLPAGAAGGTPLRVPGEGYPAYGARPAGDLQLQVTMRPHPTFMRRGDDLVTALDVPHDVAVQGGQVPVATLNGTKQVMIPPGVRSGQKLLLQGLGMPRSDGTRGGLFVSLNVAAAPVPPPEPSARLDDVFQQLFGGPASSSPPAAKGGASGEPGKQPAGAQPSVQAHYLGRLRERLLAGGYQIRPPATWKTYRLELAATAGSSPQMTLRTAVIAAVLPNPTPQSLRAFSRAAWEYASELMKGQRTGFACLALALVETLPAEGRRFLEKHDAWHMNSNEYLAVYSTGTATLVASRPTALADPRNARGHLLAYLTAD